MNKINIEGKEYPIKWDYGVIFDVANELEIEFVEEVYDILISWSDETEKTKVKTMSELAVMVKHMIIAAGGEEVSSRSILNSFFTNPDNQISLVKEIEDNSPKASETEQDKKKVGKTSVLTS